MAKAKGKRKSQVRNLKPRSVRDSRHVKGGFSKINPVDPTPGGGTINDKIN